MCACVCPFVLMHVCVSMCHACPRSPTKKIIYTEGGVRDDCKLPDQGAGYRSKNL